MHSLKTGERFWFRDHFELQAGTDCTTIYVRNHGPGVLHRHDENGTGFGPDPAGAASVSWTMEADRQFLELWRGDEATFEVVVAYGQWEEEDIERALQAEGERDDEGAGSDPS